MKKNELESISEEELENIAGGDLCGSHFSDYVDGSSYDNYFKYHVGEKCIYQNANRELILCKIVHRLFLYYSSHDSEKIYVNNIKYKLYEIICCQPGHNEELTVKEDELLNKCF